MITDDCFLRRRFDDQTIDSLIKMVFLLCLKVEEEEDGFSSLFVIRVLFW
ncbi:hypothetical protein AtEden1_Chr5g0109781 [Arabidopsis thaliana]